MCSVDTEADLGTKAKEIAKQVGDSQLKDGRMRDFYRWLFDFVKADSKSVGQSIACAFECVAVTPEAVSSQSLSLAD